MLGPDTYLYKKQIEGLNFRQTHDGTLISRVRNIDGEIVGFQQVIRVSGGIVSKSKSAPKGRLPDKFEKRFTKGTESKGGMDWYGDLAESSKIYVAEGQATTESIYVALKKKHAYVCTYSAGNVPEVVANLHQRFPSATIIICIDQDKAGEDAAQEAIQRVPGADIRIASPGFKNPGKGKNDFNDLMCEKGRGAVRRRLKKAKRIGSEKGTSVFELTNGLPPSDTAFASLFVKQHARNIRNAAGVWFVWDGRRWKKDDCGLVQELAKETASWIFQMAKEQSHSAQIRELSGWGAKSLNRRQIDAGIGLAKSSPDIRVEMSDFDSDPLLFNCLNATIDLRTGVARKQRREDLITKVAATEHDADAKCPLFRKVLNTIFADSKSLIAYMQRAAGYSLTGLTREQCLMILHGNGSNGKSLLLETLHDMFGDYSGVASIETLMPRRGAIPNDIAKLCGVRLVTVGETQAGARLNESLVKDLTGGDTVTARFLQKEYFDFRPCMKIFIRANHRPSIRDTDHGIWRRIREIPFNVTIKDKDQDKALAEKLRKEFPGILNWAIKGCLQWQKKGLRSPSEVRRATKSYQLSQDILHHYLKDRIRKKSGSYVIRTALHGDYVEWCKESGETAVKRAEFNEAMEKRGFTSKRRSAGEGWNDIEFKT